MKQIYLAPEMNCFRIGESDLLTASSDFVSQNMAPGDYADGDYAGWE